jgi:ABC-2 type transport system permease protein
MIALYRKELRSTFTSWTGYVYLAVFSLISGFIFTTGNLLSQNGDIKSYFASICTVLVLLVPILTMRVFAEERKLRTLQLLFTMPLSLVDIVAGKFLATLTVFGIGLVPTLAYPVILASYGGVETAVVAGNYLGLLMLVSACIAIGLFVSALTENQLIAAVVTYALLLALWLLDTTGLESAAGTGVPHLAYLSLNRHFQAFTYGIFNPADIVFFASLTLLFLAFCVLTLDARKTA